MIVCGVRVNVAGRGTMSPARIEGGYGFTAGQALPPARRRTLLLARSEGVLTPQSAPAGRCSSRSPPLPPITVPAAIQPWPLLNACMSAVAACSFAVPSLSAADAA